jgi:hypothetical protein
VETGVRLDVEFGDGYGVVKLGSAVREPRGRHVLLAVESDTTVTRPSTDAGHPGVRGSSSQSDRSRARSGREGLASRRGGLSSPGPADLPVPRLLGPGSAALRKGRSWTPPAFGSGPLRAGSSPASRFARSRCPRYMARAPAKDRAAMVFGGSPTPVAKEEPVVRAWTDRWTRCENGWSLWRELTDGCASMEDGQEGQATQPRKTSEVGRCRV